MAGWRASDRWKRPWPSPRGSATSFRNGGRDRMSVSLTETDAPARHPMDVPLAGSRRPLLRRLLAAAAVIAALVTGIELLRRGAPAIAVDRSTVVMASVERGMLIREARGTGELVAEHTRMIAAE